MNTIQETVVFQEVPDEISLCFLITGCNIGCKGCHSSESWNPTSGFHLSLEHFTKKISEYKDMVSCILFLGGEWESRTLSHFLTVAKNHGYKTCLYTGLELNEFMSNEDTKSLLSCLDFLKTGKWVSELGGLNSLTTNQRFYSINKSSFHDLTYKFQNQKGI